MKKRILSLLIVVSMLSALAVGCNSKDTKEKDTSDTSDVVTEGTKEYPVVKMNYSIVGGNKDEKAIEDALNVIMREKAGAEVDLIGIEFGNWATQLNLMLTGGDNSLDLFSSFWYTSLSNLVSNGQVMPLDDLLASDGTGILEQFEGYEEYLNCARINGKLYGTPSIYAWSCENQYLAVREDAEAANIDWSKVNDLDSMTEAMIAMKQVNPDKYYIPGSTEPYWIPKDIDYLGDTNFLGVLTDPVNSTKVENYYESEYFINFLEKVKIWKEHDLFSPDPLSNSDPTLVNLMYGVANGTPGYNWDAKIGINSTSTQFGVDVVGSAVTEPLATTGDVTTYIWHISSFTKNPEAAMRVLNVLYTDAEAANIIANGLEGVHHIINEDGQMEYPEGKAMADLEWAAGSMAYWPNITLCKTWNHEPEDIYDQMREKNSTANKSLALGFQFDSTPVADQMTACANVVAQYYAPLMYAEADIDATLPEFQKALQDAGINEIIAEKQRQLDEWLASK